MEICRYRGPESPVHVDPYWDFLPTTTEERALRIWRIRLHAAGQGPLRVDVRHLLFAAGGRASLPARDCLFHCAGEDPLWAPSWHPVGSNVFFLDPPRVVLGVNLSSLPPGAHALSLAVEDAPAPEPLWLRIRRRPVYRFTKEVETPAVRAASTVLRAERGSPTAVIHAWRVRPSTWVEACPPKQGYSNGDPLFVRAITRLDGRLRRKETRFRVSRSRTRLTSWESDFEEGHSPDTHAQPPEGEDPTDGRLGLPFPTLLGF